MKKAITTTCLILSAVIILDSFYVWHAVAMFYLAGEIPGTRTSISAGTMMSVFAVLTGFVLARIGNKAVLSLFNRIALKRSHQNA
jgi:hypothetical protein